MTTKPLYFQLNGCTMRLTRDDAKFGTPQGFATPDDLAAAGFVPVADLAESRSQHERIMRDIRAAAKGESVTADYDSGALQLVLDLRTELAQQYDTLTESLLRADRETEQIKLDARRMHYLGSLVRSRTSSEQDELTALARRYPPLAWAPDHYKLKNGQ